MTGTSFRSHLHVDRIQDDHAYRLIQEIHDLPPILDVMVRRPVRLERLLAPVSLEQMERATSFAFLVEVVPLAPRFRSRPLDHPCEQRAEVARSPLARTERSEDGHRDVGHVHLTSGSSDPGRGVDGTRSERGVYPPTRAERSW